MSMNNSFFVVQVVIAARNVTERKLDRDTAWADFAMSIHNLSAEQTMALRDLFVYCCDLILSDLKPVER